MNKIYVTVQDLYKIIHAADDHGVADDVQFALVGQIRAGIGSTLEVQFVTGAKTKTVVEIYGVEDW